MAANDVCMKRYVITREIPEIGAKTPDELKGAAKVSCAAIRDIGNQVQWVHSYVMKDKVILPDVSSPLKS